MEPLFFIASSAFLTNVSAASPVKTGTLLIAIAIIIFIKYLIRCKITNNNPFRQTFPPISLNNHPSIIINNPSHRLQICVHLCKSVDYKTLRKRAVSIRAKAIQTIREIREDAKNRPELTLEEINAEINAVRKARRQTV